MDSLTNYLDKHLKSLPILEDSKESSILKMIGEQIKEKRKAAHLSQIELSRRCGVSQGIISKIENGLYNPSLIELQKILQPLGAKVEVR